MKVKSLTFIQRFWFWLPLLLFNFQIEAESQKPILRPSRITKKFILGVYHPPLIDGSKVTLEEGLKNMVKAGMNAVINMPFYTLKGKRGEAKEAISALKEKLKIYRKYGIYVMPLLRVEGVGTEAEKMVLSSVEEVAKAFKDDGIVLGWIVYDEPPPSLLPSFEKIRDAVSRQSPQKPAVVISYRVDWAKLFSRKSPIVLTDQYTFTLKPEQTSVGPHLDPSSKDYDPKAAPNSGKPFGAWGVLHWVDLVRSEIGLPHWVTLQAFSGDTVKGQARWRRPTPSEMRLQTWLAVAGQVHGIIYFRYGVRDLFHQSGKPTPLWRSIEEVGRKVSQVGLIFAEAIPLRAGVIPLEDETPQKGSGVDLFFYKHPSLKIFYLLVINNDLNKSQKCRILLPKFFVKNRRLYDLFEMKEKPLEDLKVELKPGDAMAYALASPYDWKILRKKLNFAREVHQQ